MSKKIEIKRPSSDFGLLNYITDELWTSEYLHISSDQMYMYDLLFERGHDILSYSIKKIEAPIV